MRAIHALTLDRLFGRPLRTGLLVLAVASAACLVTLVAAGLDTIEASMRHFVGRHVGHVDARITHRFHGSFKAGLLETLADHPGVHVAAGRFDASVTLSAPDAEARLTGVAMGVDPASWWQVHTPRLRAGRPLTGPGEAVIDPRVARRLKVGVGDPLRLRSLSGEVRLRVTGILERPELEVLQQPGAFVPRPVAEKLAGVAGELHRIDIDLAPGTSREHLARSLDTSLPPNLAIKSGAAATAGLDRLMHALRLLHRLMTGFLFLAAGAIVLTGLSASLIERESHLGLLRAIGAGRAQIAGSELTSGLAIGLAGGLLGIPLGLIGAAALAGRYSDLLPAGFHAAPLGPALAGAAAAGAGLLGGAWPALAALRVAPRQAMRVGSRPPWWPGVGLALAAGGAGLGAGALALHHGLGGASLASWTLILWMPLALVAGFCLAVPLFLLTALLLAWPLGTLLRLPPPLLLAGVAAGPYRHGFTAGALMLGPALLVAIGTTGESVMDHVFDRMAIPDAFAQSYHPLTAAELDAVRSAPGVTQSSPTTLFPVQALAVKGGEEATSPPRVLYVSVEPESLTAMTDLDWIAGDPETAVRRVRDGRGVIVNAAFTRAHGLALQDAITLNTLEGPVDFEIAGVARSGGLEIATEFFGISGAYQEAATRSLLGSFANAERYFGVRSVNLVLLDLAPEAEPAEVLAGLKQAVPGLRTGQSRRLIAFIRAASRRIISLLSLIAWASLLITALGVSHLLMAELAARQRELGILRAVGAGQGLLVRHLLAEVLLIGLTAVLLGSLLGVHLAWMLLRLNHHLAGLTYPLVLAWERIATGVWVTFALALIAALPLAIRLYRTPARKLLGAA